MNVVAIALAKMLLEGDSIPYIGTRSSGTVYLAPRVDQVEHLQLQDHYYRW